MMRAATLSHRLYLASGEEQSMMDGPDGRRYVTNERVFTNGICDDTDLEFRRALHSSAWLHLGSGPHCDQG